MRESERCSKTDAMLSAVMEAARSQEGSAVSLTKGLPAMDFIMSKLEEDREQYKRGQNHGPLIRWL